ncbi:hypothetical protein [Natronosalvus rutilus]|uniref:Uncharacterized protein n=1 Tax=Natronosalvus rutilus TaxID=2953753 RepID=A0A9E7SX45_9EURY|nr:hypothetical protein [Natronosalvus rutilus]UTF56035.1 hypothetical protein NGM29_20830 [Natronosalvus rutilus]
MSEEETYALGADPSAAEALQEGGPVSVDDVDETDLPSLYEVTVSETSYETKTIRFHLQERGQYLYLMLTRFDGERNILGEIGYGGEYIQFQSMSSNNKAQVASTDLYGFAEKHPFPLTKLYPFDLLYRLDIGEVPWGAITDGDQLSEADVTALLREHGGEVKADAN